MIPCIFAATANALIETSKYFGASFCPAFAAAIPMRSVMSPNNSAFLTANPAAADP